MLKKDRQKTNEKADDLLLESAKPNLKSSLKAEISAITKVSDALQHLDKETCQRVLKWAENRFIGDKDDG